MMISDSRQKRLLPILAALVGALLLLNLAGSLSYRVGALQIEMRAKLLAGLAGKTRLALPPLGVVEAPTHRLPVTLQVTLESIDLSLIRDMAFPTGGPEEVLVHLVHLAQGALGLFLLKACLLMALGGMLGVWLIGERSWRRLTGGLAVGAACFLLLAGAVALSFDPAAFAQPEYTGVLEAAPWMVGLLQDSWQRVGELGDQLQVLASNLYSLYERVQELEPLGVAEPALKVLHVSDIHNNVAAFDFIQQVAASFGVDLIIDTGDLTDFGTPLELGLVDRIEELGVPYLFVPGNHETPEVVRRLREGTNVVVLDGQQVEFSGLRILGVADGGASQSSPAAMSLAQVEQMAGMIDGLVADMEPLLLAVHNHRVAALVKEEVPVILYGHDHRLGVKSQEGRVLVGAGTTGAAGIRSLQAKESIPFSMALLYFGGEELELLAVDTIKVDTLPGGFTLERFAFGSKD
jgi:predicted phosphodiesterase